MVLMLVYIITMFFLALGAKSITQLPVTIYSSVHSVSGSVTSELGHAFGSIDSAVNTLTGTTD